MAPRKSKRLTALGVSRIRKPGMYPDGDGLYLSVAGSEENARAAWVLRYRFAGRRRDMGLGSLSTVGLAAAREAAAEARKLIAAGRDPIRARQADREAAKVEAAKAMTFEKCAEAYIESHKVGWRNEKHGNQWSATLKAYAYPVFGNLPVQSIDTGLVLKALRPIWTKKPETASRVRGRIEAILDWATVSGYRAGENPARWRGHLKKMLPERSKVRAVKHHAALPHREVGIFMAKLRAEEGVSARALEFLILTVARTSEVTGAQRPEIDRAASRWTVPPERMKARRPHRVPLSSPALSVVKAMEKVKTGPYVFPGGRRGRPLSINAMRATLQRMGYGEFTVHGFRSAFRDWAAEATTYPREVVEAALAHAPPDKTEAAYLRSDFFERRIPLMADWAKYCGTVRKTGNVVPIRQRKA